MKKILTLLLLALPMAIMAQSVELIPTYAAPEGNDGEEDLYYIFDDDRMTATVGKNPQAIGDIVIPRTVKKKGATYQVTQIANGAFSDCINLRSVKIPDTVTNIGPEAFFGCTTLSSVELPNNIEYIESYVFDRCSSLKSITIPSSVKEIKNEAFNECIFLQQIYCLAEEVPSIYYHSFDEQVYENATLSVPRESIQAYKHDDFWRRFNNINDVFVVIEYQNNLRTFFEVLNVGENAISPNLRRKLEEGQKKIDECDNDEEAAQAMNEAKNALITAYINKNGLTPATPEGPGMRMKVTTNSDKVYEFKTQDVKSVDYYRVNE